MSTVIIPKALLLVVAIISMGLGIHSHFYSNWVHYNIGGGESIKPYAYCNGWIPKEVKSILKCPPISLERYFVSVVILSFIWTIFSLLLTVFLKQDNNKKLKSLDVWLHLILGILLFIGAIVYNHSTQQINTIFKFLTEWYGESFYEILNEGQLRPERIAAVVIAIVQSIFHVGLAFIIYRRHAAISKS